MPTYPASAKQTYWITKLVDKKVIPDTLRAKIKQGLVDNSITKKEAGEFLNVLFDKNTKDIPVPGQVTEPGFYLKDGSVYKVEPSKTTGHLYAKLVTPKGFSWELGKGMMSFLKANMKLTPGQLCAYGASTGICCNCAKKLTDPISQEIGLGTQCGPIIMGKENYKIARKNIQNKLGKTLVETVEKKEEDQGLFGEVVTR